MNTTIHSWGNCCSRCSGHTGHGKQDRPLQRSLSDDLLLALYI